MLSIDDPDNIQNAHLYNNLPYGHLIIFLKEFHLPRKLSVYKTEQTFHPHFSSHISFQVMGVCATYIPYYRCIVQTVLYLSNAMHNIIIN